MFFLVLIANYLCTLYTCIFNYLYLYAVSICTVAVYYTLKYYVHGSLFFFKKTAMHDVFECYMHGSLLFSKNTAECYILECYMHGSLFFSENTAVCYIVECYMTGSSIQFAVLKPLSYCFEETIGFDK